MQNLKSWSDERLLENAAALVRQERELLSEILEHLTEIERRRLFSSLGFSSLYDYAVRKLGYSEDEAYRRIQAMRLLKKLPEEKEKIQAAMKSGALKLSHLCLADRAFQAKAKEGKAIASGQRAEIVVGLAGLSTREATRRMETILPSVNLHRFDNVRELGNGKAELRVEVGVVTAEKIAKLRGLLAHAMPRATMGELIDRALDIAIQELDPRNGPRGIRKVRRGRAESLGEELGGETGEAELPASNSPAAPREQSSPFLKEPPRTEPQPRTAISDPAEQSPHAPRRRATLSRPIVREVYRRDSGRCRNCGTNYALEIDHIQPLALGGSDEPTNLRLLCRSCNQRAAIAALGHKRMERFLEGSTPV